MMYIALILFFLFCWAMLSTIFLLGFGGDKAIDKLKYFDEDYSLKVKYEKEKREKLNLLKMLSSIIPSISLSKKGSSRLQSQLIKADINITLEELTLIKILSSSFITFIAYILLKEILLALALFISIWNIPRFVIANKTKKRVREFEGQLSEGIAIISNSLKAGYSFLQAIAVVAEETKDPFSKEFKKLLKEMSLGIAEEDALKNLLLRVDSEDLRLIMNAILIQKDIGGNLSEILDNISETIRERQKIKNELKALTAQGKLSGIIIGLMPILLCGIIYLFSKEYMGLLFTTNIGLAMVALSIINQVMGVVMIRKIINIEM